MRKELLVAGIGLFMLTGCVEEGIQSEENTTQIELSATREIENILQVKDLELINVDTNNPHKTEVYTNGEKVWEVYYYKNSRTYISEIGKISWKNRNRRITN